jgi:hypothetical protein
MIMVRSFYRGPRTYLSRWDIEKMYGGAAAFAVSDAEAIAFHEAGHAVVGRALGRPVAEVFIANGGGGCRSVPARPWAEGDAAQAKLLNAVVSGLRPSARARNTFFPDLVSLAAGGIAQAWIDALVTTRMIATRSKLLQRPSPKARRMRTGGQSN